MVPDAIRELVAAQEDMEVVGDCRGPMKILQETGRTKADAVILTQQGLVASGLSSQLLAVYPDLIILSLAPHVGAAFVQQLRSRRHELLGAEKRDMMQVIRLSVNDLCESQSE